MRVLLFVVVLLATGVYLFLRWTAAGRKEAAEASAMLRSKMLNREFQSENPDLRGVAMDWGVGGSSVSTLVSLSDGSTSLYFSSGGGMLGLGEREGLQGAAEAFRAAVTAKEAEFSAVTDFPPPPSGHVVFYVLGESATVSSGVLRVRDIEQVGHSMEPIWRASNELITAARKEVGWF